MKRTILKKDIGKYIVVKWLDPRRGDRESLKDFLVKPFEVIITTGKVKSTTSSLSSMMMILKKKKILK